MIGVTLVKWIIRQLTIVPQHLDLLPTMWLCDLSKFLSTPYLFLKERWYEWRQLAPISNPRFSSWWHLSMKHLWNHKESDASSEVQIIIREENSSTIRHLTFLLVGMHSIRWNSVNYYKSFRWASQV